MNINTSIVMFKDKKIMLLFPGGCSWTGSLLVSKACKTLLIRASEIVKPLSHQCSCKQITGMLPLKKNLPLF